jgi:hypothetical protein
MAVAISPLWKPLTTHDVPGMRALLTATPALANTPLNSNAPGETPLNFALGGGFIPEAKTLVEFGGRASVKALLRAAVSCSVPMLTWVIDSGLDADTSDPAIGAAALGSTQSNITPAAKRDTIQFLLSRGVPPRGMFVLAVQSYPDIVTLLVAGGHLTPADLIPQTPESPMYQVVWNGAAHPLTYALLPDGSNALFVAVSSGAALGPVLAAAPGKLNSTLPAVGTPLHFALAKGNLAAATALVAAGADLAFRLPTGESALGAAARGKSGACVAFIAGAIRAAHGPAALASAINAPETTVRGRVYTPLVRACVAYAPPAVFTALLDAGADPNQECQGSPPAAWLGWAASSKNEAHAAVASGWDPAAAMRIIAAGAPGFPKPNFDVSLPGLSGRTVREFNAQYGITI